jgi:hypothetical protein
MHQIANAIMGPTMTSNGQNVTYDVVTGDSIDICSCSCGGGACTLVGVDGGAPWVTFSVGHVLGNANVLGNAPGKCPDLPCPHSRCGRLPGRNNLCSSRTKTSSKNLERRCPQVWTISL